MPMSFEVFEGKKATKAVEVGAIRELRVVGSSVENQEI